MRFLQCGTFPAALTGRFLLRLRGRFVRPFFLCVFWMDEIAGDTVIASNHEHALFLEI